MKILKKILKKINTPKLESVNLTNWAVYEVTSELWPNTTQHFVGYDVNHDICRVSSPIVKFDQTKMSGITANHKIYNLHNEYGLTPAGHNVLNEWIQEHRITNIIEVLYKRV